MGILYMGREFGFRHKGCSYGTDILFVYCDECGSFNVKKRVGLGKWLLIVGTCLLLVLIRILILKPNAARDWLLSNECFTYLIVLVVIYVYWTACKELWGDTDYRCRDCGNTKIVTNDRQDYPSMIGLYNTWEYPSNKDVVDVPDRLTQKRYMGYWDDDYR
jgi:hypothetical protein